MVVFYFEGSRFTAQRVTEVIVTKNTIFKIHSN